MFNVSLLDDPKRQKRFESDELVVVDLFNANDTKILPNGVILPNGQKRYSGIEVEERYQLGVIVRFYSTTVLGIPENYPRYDQITMTYEVPTVYQKCTFIYVNEYLVMLVEGRQLGKFVIVQDVDKSNDKKNLWKLDEYERVK